MFFRIVSASRLPVVSLALSVKLGGDRYHPHAGYLARIRGGLQFYPDNPQEFYWALF
jgi:hypothetical protein